MEPSPAVDDDTLSLGGEPPDARARRAGGLYRPCIWVSANLFAKTAEGAGGGVLPLDGPLANAPGPSLADKDIIDDTIRDYGVLVLAGESFRISWGISGGLWVYFPGRIKVACRVERVILASVVYRVGVSRAMDFPKAIGRRAKN